MIGPACDADLPSILRMACALWDESPALRALPLDMDALAVQAWRLVADGTLLVAGDADPEGFMAFVVDGSTATDRGLYVVPERRAAGVAGELVAAAVGVAMRRGCQWFLSGDSTGTSPDATRAVYARAGFDVTGSVFRRSLVPVAVQG